MGLNLKFKFKTKKHMLRPKSPDGFTQLLVAAVVTFKMSAIKEVIMRLVRMIRCLVIFDENI